MVLPRRCPPSVVLGEAGRGSACARREQLDGSGPIDFQQHFAGCARHGRVAVEPTLCAPALFLDTRTATRARSAFVTWRHRRGRFDGGANGTRRPANQNSERSGHGRKQLPVQPRRARLRRGRTWPWSPSRPPGALRPAPGCSLGARPGPPGGGHTTPEISPRTHERKTRADEEIEQS